MRDLCFCVDFGVVLEQQPHHVKVAVLGCNDEAVPPVLRERAGSTVGMGVSEKGVGKRESERENERVRDIDR